MLAAGIEPAKPQQVKKGATCAPCLISAGGAVPADRQKWRFRLKQFLNIPKFQLFAECKKTSRQMAHISERMKHDSFSHCCRLLNIPRLYASLRFPQNLSNPLYLSFFLQVSYFYTSSIYILSSDPVSSSS